MSHFSRNWSGEHYEECPWADTEWVVHTPDGTHGWSRRINEGEQVRMKAVCALFITGIETAHDCKCPEIMTEREVDAADRRMDQIRDHGE